MRYEVIVHYVTHNIWVPDGTHELTLLLEPSDGQSVLPSTRYLLVSNRIEKSWVEDFSSTEEVVTFGLTNSSITSDAQGLIFKELNRLKPDALIT